MSQKTVNVAKNKKDKADQAASVDASDNVSEIISFYYSASGTLLELGYSQNGEKEHLYTVITNVMGDVVALYTPYGTLVGTYSYDSYGRITQIKHNDNYKDADGILEKNPFRYRGYYYDTETEWYYLNSRYYDPETKRFINGDSTQLLTNTPENLMQYNLFMYCNGDPVDNIDPLGLYSILKARPIFFMGLSTSVGAGIGGMAGEQIIVDPVLVKSDWAHSIGVQRSSGLGVIGGEQAAFSLSLGFVLANSIKDTERWFRVIGVDVDCGSGVGGDILIGGNPSDKSYCPGVSVSFDILGEGGDVHGYYTYTGETEYIFEKEYIDERLMAYIILLNCYFHEIKVKK